MCSRKCETPLTSGALVARADVDPDARARRSRPRPCVSVTTRQAVSRTVVTRRVMCADLARPRLRARRPRPRARSLGRTRHPLGPVEEVGEARRQRRADAGRAPRPRRGTWRDARWRARPSAIGRIAALGAARRRPRRRCGDRAPRPVALAGRGDGRRWCRRRRRGGREQARAAAPAGRRPSVSAPLVAESAPSAATAAPPSRSMQLEQQPLEVAGDLDVHATGSRSA